MYLVTGKETQVVGSLWFQGEVEGLNFSPASRSKDPRALGWGGGRVVFVWGPGGRETRERRQSGHENPFQPTQPGQLLEEFYFQSLLQVDSCLLCPWRL